MPLHRSHNRLQPQPPRHDELPDGVPAPVLAPAGAGERDAKGRFKPGNRSAAAAGGRAKRARVEHLHRLGLDWLAAPPKDPHDPRQAELHRAWSEHRKQAARQLKAEQGWLARTHGGGILDPSAATELKSAVELEALGRLLTSNPKFVDGDVGSTLALAQRLLTAARGHRLTAVELAARGAQARQAQGRAGGGGAARLLEGIDVEEQFRRLQETLATTGEGSDHDDE